MALDLDVDQQIAKLVIMYPAMQSRGMTTPTNDVRTSGKKQYPNTLAFCVNVSVLGVGSAPGYPGGVSGVIKLRIMYKVVEPIRARL
jgi:hypothetical protein